MVSALGAIRKRARTDLFDRWLTSATKQTRSKTLRECGAVLVLISRTASLKDSVAELKGRLCDQTLSLLRRDTRFLRFSPLLPLFAPFGGTNSQTGSKSQIPHLSHLSHQTFGQFTSVTSFCGRAKSTLQEVPPLVRLSAPLKAELI